MSYISSQVRCRGAVVDEPLDVDVGDDTNVADGGKATNVLVSTIVGLALEPDANKLLAYLSM